MRVSDAERAEVADRLSKHYSDGRLDEAEFNERIDQAMRAKTHADLGGLLSDLPASEPAETPKSAKASGTAAPVPRPRPARRNHRFLELVLIILVAVIAWNVLVHSFIPWLLIGVIAVLWLLYGPRRHRRP
jgi:hypothetical protein